MTGSTQTRNETSNYYTTNKEYQSCIDVCNKCAQECYSCAQACLNEPDVSARTKCISTLINCAQMCQMSVAFMAMNSDFSKQQCATCATICEECSNECAKFKDEHCERCAKICSKCAEECRNMASM